MTTSQLPRILRKRGDPEYPTFLELFFDLVYIFMLSRLSAGLASELTVRNALQIAVLLMAAWWVWVLTAWLTDLFNPRLPLIQALVLVIMFGILTMAVTVPRAFGAYGGIFVAAYFGIHVARDAVLIRGTRVHPGIQARSIRVFFWLGVTAGLWIAGALTGPTPRLVLWAVAAAVDLASARIGWPTPGLGRTELASQIFTGSHLTERHRQIFIISLGELILTAGTALAASHYRAGPVLTCAVLFGSAVVLFQLYSQRVRQLLAPGNVSAVERVRPGTATSYTHLVMVGGVVVIAASASVVLDQPFGPAPAGTIVAILAGPALFLSGSCQFDYVVTGRPLWSRLIALGVLAGLGPVLPLLPRIGIFLAANLVLLATLIAELTVLRQTVAPRPA